MSSENPNPYPESGSSGPRNILDLPNEMLINIFANFESLNATYHRVVGIDQTDDEKKLAEDSRKTIVSARLVCRKFHKTASQFLLPIVVVKLNQASLDRVAEILRSPAVSSGIRGVRVVANCHLKRPMLNLQLFLEYKMFLIKKYSDLDHGLRGSWDAFALSVSTSTCPENAELQRFMLVAQHEYRRRYDEQIELVAGGFSSQLAALIRRMPRFTSLEFVNFRTSVPNIDIKTMSDKCYEFLVEGDTWEDIEGVPETWEMHLDGRISPVVLFILLPVAIHREGVILRGMHIRCFPALDHNIGIFYPGDSEDDLFDEFRHLEHVTVGEIPYLDDIGGHLDSPHASTFGLAIVSLENYLRAVLSGPQLKTVRLNPHSFSDEIGKISCPGSCPQGQVDGETFFLDAIYERLDMWR